MDSFVTHNKKGPSGKPLSPYFKWSGQEDLNLRPPAPKLSTLLHNKAKLCVYRYLLSPFKTISANRGIFGFKSSLNL